MKFLHLENKHKRYMYVCKRVSHANYEFYKNGSPEAPSVANPTLVFQHYSSPTPFRIQTYLFIFRVIALVIRTRNFRNIQIFLLIKMIHLILIATLFRMCSYNSVCQHLFTHDMQKKTVHVWLLVYLMISHLYFSLFAIMNQNKKTKNNFKKF